MNKFKLLRGYKGNLNVRPDVTYSSASFHDGFVESRNRETIERLDSTLNSIGELQTRLFQATTTITVKPNLWTRIKIFGTGVKLVLKECWQHEPGGVVVVGILTTLITSIGIAKLFGL